MASAGATVKILPYRYVSPYIGKYTELTGNFIFYFMPNFCCLCVYAVNL